MTRQKKEILNKIDEIAGFIEADEQLGCGFAPEGAYDKAYEQIDSLYDELAHLRHYKDGNEMMMDTRGLYPDPEIPFN